MLVIGKNDIVNLLNGRESEVIDCIDSAYRLHYAGKSRLPYSSFLRFPDKLRDRIIALPAYLGGENEMAGIKWISSFPENVKNGIPRASASIILNSMETGRPVALLEGAVISAARTAASAALATKLLDRRGSIIDLGMVGCGYIQWHIFRFIKHVFPNINKAFLFDSDVIQARSFAARLKKKYSDVNAEIVNSVPELIPRSHVISFATTASEPYLTEWRDIDDKTLVLHISLRDLTPELILGATNVVDDVEHVCREKTSVDLAVKRAKGNWKPRWTLADFLIDRDFTKHLEKKPIVFSPFGLGVLDVALADFVYEQALKLNKGQWIHEFC